MKTSLLALLAALLSVPASAAENAGSAKAALAQATARAKQWQADAVLTNLSTLGANPDGTATTWNYLFYSPKAEKWYTVTAKGGKLETLEASMGLTDSVGEFIDSDQAMQEAKKNGLKGKDKPIMGLAWMGSTKDGAAYWTVGGGFGPGEVGVVLDAKTGKFFTRHEMK